MIRCRCFACRTEQIVREAFTFLACAAAAITLVLLAATLADLGGTCAAAATSTATATNTATATATGTATSTDTAVPTSTATATATMTAATPVGTWPVPRVTPVFVVPALTPVWEGNP